jgi:hypothetical protein
MIPSWDDGFPERARLECEVESMVESFVEVLQEEMPRDQIAGIYLKGSAQKNWESPLDYVPEVSDVDIHLRVVDGSPAEVDIQEASTALRIQSRVEERFLRKAPSPLHVPRPQLLLLNMLEREEEYVPSPRRTVRVLLGDEYPLGDYSDEHRIRRMDCRRLSDEAEYLRDFALHAIDKPHKYIWTSMRTMNWHISPSGPRMLSLLGIPPGDAWSMNRTSIVRLLEEKGERKAAQDYSKYYLEGWQYFLSNFDNHSAARNALSCAVEVLRRGVEIADSWSSKHC